MQGMVPQAEGTATVKAKESGACANPMDARRKTTGPNHGQIN